jgi:ubiquinone/menaquinone biosynthesis C-methylase UbiE
MEDAINEAVAGDPEMIEEIDLVRATIRAVIKWPPFGDAQEDVRQLRHKRRGVGLDQIGVAIFRANPNRRIFLGPGTLRSRLERWTSDRRRVILALRHTDRRFIGDWQENQMLPSFVFDPHVRPQAVVLFETERELVGQMVSLLRRWKIYYPRSESPRARRIVHVGSRDSKKTNVFDPTRLEIQAHLSHDIDMKIIAPIVDRLCNRFPGQKIEILDVGCGYGDVVANRFGNDDRVSVLGIDSSQDAIKNAKRRFKKRDLRFCACNATTFVPQRKLHLVLMMQLLQHVKDPGGMLQRFWRFLAPGGILLCKNSDDQLNITFPLDGDLEYLIQETAQILKSPDRQIGRKLFRWFKELKPAPENVEVGLLPQCVTSSDVEARLNFFDAKHGFRPSYAFKAAETERSEEAIARSVLFAFFTERQRQRFAKVTDLFAAEVQIFVSGERRASRQKSRHDRGDFKRSTRKV